MVESQEVPPLAVTRLLSARYPTLEVDLSWLQGCVEELRQRDASLRSGTPDQLARAVRQHLLDSDLSKVVGRSYCRLSPDILGRSAGSIGDPGRGAVLVQIESMLDIGLSASSQLEIAEARREARRANVDPNDVTEDVKAAQAAASSSADHMADFQTQEEDKVQGTTVFPRRMLRLQLSDGSKAGSVAAIELERIAGLDMNTTKIGTKLLLKGAAVKGGYLLLSPKTVVVEGGCVAVKDAVAEQRLIESLRKQLGKPLVEHQDKNGQACRDAHPSNSTRYERGFSPDEDESALLAAIEAEEQMRTDAPRPSATRSKFKPLFDEQATSRDISTDHAEPEQPARKRANLIIPEGMKQKKGSQQSDTATGARATQGEPIMIDDSDDDELFAAIPDNVLSGVKLGSEGGEATSQHSSSRRTVAASASRDDPIVIESSPEP